nr:MAG TPA: hypothetical protein [Caudoviricetes sp.]
MMRHSGLEERLNKESFLALLIKGVKGDKHE